MIFHVLCQAIAIQFNTGSRETRLFIESQGLLIQERLAKLTPTTREEIIDEILDEIKTDGSIKWNSLKDVIATKKLKLSELLIQDGDIILQQDEFLNKYADDFTDRSPDRMYNILIGDSVKELILSRLIILTDVVQADLVTQSRVNSHRMVSRTTCSTQQVFCLWLVP